jgi:peroxiredoxin
MKKYLVILILVVIAFACTTKNSVKVSGTVKEKKQEYISLYRVDINTPVLIDSVKMKGNGKFSFVIKATEPDFYQLGFKDDFITLLAKPGEKVSLDFPGRMLCNNYSVSGSEGSEMVRTLDVRLIETKARVDSITALYEKASTEPGFETTGPPLEKQYLELLQEQRKFNIGFIIGNTTSLASIKALYQRINDETYVLYQSRDLQYLKIVADSLKKYHPGSKHTKALISDFENELNQFYSRQLQQISSTLPETVLNPELKDVSGKKIALSSLRGKYVLLTFWSIRSRECIADNLQLKEFYRTYNKRGFEIYQVNLDEDESAWKAALRFDDIPWISTREDDPANPVTAQLYNVKTLPANYLYDRDGNIIATNIHGRTLQLKLNQLFPN